MKQRTSEILQKTKKEMSRHKIVYLILGITLLLAFWIRVYRVMDLMGFYYDQGRDALVIWDLWHKGKPFLIGPITGLKGIFLGPFYYYLIAPFYLIGRGNPAYPAVFLSFTTVLAVFMLYFLGAKMHSRTAGLLAAFIGSFSYNIFTLSRWLSNPTPMLLLSMLLFWFLWEISVSNSKFKIQNSKFSISPKLRGVGKTQNPTLQTTNYTLPTTNPWWWVLAVFTIGISLHFESASAVFYMPLFLVFSIWQRKKLPPFKYVLVAGGFFFATLLPQLLFNIRHDNLLLDNFLDLFFGEKAFRGFNEFILGERLKYFWGVYAGKVFAGRPLQAIVIIVISLAIYISDISKFKKKTLPLFAIFFLTPVIGYTFFQGNYGNIYDYYTIGYFMPLILFFSIGLGELLKHWGGVLILIWFFYHFITLNYMLISNYLTATPATRPIALEDQLKAVNWVIDDAKKNVAEFNVDIYVPPVIPHSYEYLLLWQTDKRCGKLLCGYKKDITVPDLYTIYEADPPNPHRLVAWLDRQKNVGVVVEETQFGQVTVQRRRRI